MKSVEVASVANSVVVQLVPLRTVGSGYISPTMPLEEAVEVEPHND